MSPIRVIIVASHPIQYFAPLYRRYTNDARLDIEVAFASLAGARPAIDPGFGVSVEWDVPMLEGYRWYALKPQAGPLVRRIIGALDPKLIRLISRGQYDLVVTHGYAKASYWVALLAAKASHARVALFSDAVDLQSLVPSAAKSRLKALGLPWLLARFDGIFALSTRSARFATRMGISSDRVHVTPYVVDTDLFATLSAQADRDVSRDRLGIPRDAPVALFCGKLVPWKRPLDLIEAAVPLSNLHLIVAGDGPERQAIARSIDRHGIAGRVHMVGFRNQTELPEMYAAADFLVLPSEFERFGLVINEAFACSRPAIATSVCGAVGDLLIHGETGLVVRPRDVPSLSAAMRRLAEDAELLRTLGLGAREAITRWGPEQHAESFARACLAVVERED